MRDNVLVIADDKSYFVDKFSKFNVFRRCESFSVVTLNLIKKISFDEFSIVIINADDFYHAELAKLSEKIKKKSPNTQILYFLAKSEYELTDIYNENVYDFWTTTLSDFECELKLLNCLKYSTLLNITDILKVFVNISNSKNIKTDLYTHKAFKEAFDYLTEYKIFKNSVYAVLSIDESTKTKVSMNRLAAILKKNLRKTDIIAQGLGKFYLLLADTDLSSARIVIEKVSSLMGAEHKLHCGICKTQLKSIESIEKNALDNLKSAIINDELCVCLGENYCVDDNWVNTVENDKHFKLFKASYEKKLFSVIAPIFFLLANEFSSKSPNLFVCQYTNDIECMFSLKYANFHSKLIMRYNGYTKLNIKITHSGLDTAENKIIDVSLNKLDDKYITKILTNLYKDFLSSVSVN